MCNAAGFSKGAGAVIVFVAGGSVWRVFNRGVFSVGRGPAYEPWNNRQAEDGGLSESFV